MVVGDADAPLSIRIIEDNSEDADRIRTYLDQVTDRRVEVECSERLDEGLARIRAERPAIALVDLTLPDSSPEETIARVGEIPSDVAVVMLTGGPSEAFELDALRRGAEEFLDKNEVDAGRLERCLDHVTQRHAIRRKLELTRRAVDAAGEGVVISDARREDAPIIFANEAFLEMTGYEEDEILGRNCRFLQCEETDQRRVAEIREALEAEEPVTVELLNARKEGTRFWNHLSISPVRDETGQLTHFVGFQRDVTRRVEAERELREHQRRLERYKMIVENTTDAVVVKDAEGRYQLVNESFEHLVGASESEIIGKTAEEVFGSEIGREIRRRGRKTMEAGAIRSYEERVGTEEFQRTFLTTAIPIGEGEEVEGMIGISRDITERKRMQENLERMALYDQLTELPNRALFHDRLEQAIERVRRRGTPFAVGFVDLDDFKAVNDSFGHAAGDELMRKVASRLQASVRSEDTLARVGGDEFILLVEAVDDRKILELVADRLRERFEPPFGIKESEVHVSVSIGFAFPSEEALAEGDFELDVESLIRTADRAMYDAKRVAGTSWRVFAPSSEGTSSRRIQRANRIREGIDQGEFFPHYQPIYRLGDRSVVAVEVLARWEHPERGLVSPGKFIPLAEQSELIGDLGEAVLRRACREFSRAEMAGPEPGPLKLYVNLSPRQIERRDAVDRLVEVLGTEAPEFVEICFEVTETELLEHRIHVVALIDEGFDIIVDDFGTGYSSLSRIKEMPIDGLKLDMGFVHGITEATADAAIAETVIRLAELLEIPVVAEGIETQAQFARLAEMACDAGQGYWLARPQPFADLASLLDGGASEA